jgi:hypothetical protein
MVSDVAQFASPDTFTLLLPDPKDLQFADLQCSCELPVREGGIWVVSAAARGPFLYVIREVLVTYPARWEYEMVVISTEGDSCRVLDVQPIFSDSWPCAIGEDKAFFAWGGDSIACYTISGGTQFALKQFYRLDYPLEDMRLYDNYLVTLLRPNRLVIFDTGASGCLRKVSECSLEGWRWVWRWRPVVQRLAVQAPYLFVATGDWGIFDITDPSSPRLLAHASDAGEVEGLTAAGNRLYTWQRNGAVTVYDISAPSHPLLLHQEQAGVYGLAVAAGEWLHLLYPYPWRVTRYEPGRNLRLCGLLWDQGLFSALAGDRLYTCSSRRINVYVNRLHSGVEQHSIEPATSYALSPGFPNPFNACTHLWLSIPRREHVRVQIFNLRGELVCTLLDRVLEPGQHLVTWRGQDRSGSNLASGLYFAQLEAAGQKLSRKVLLIR